ncbi:MAG: tripartite tricarboxylate transporter permease [Sphaerochaetaceae bacterium]|nr:tripartite tricarboxylate transporter permease [Sphaerochaetaceae bacterium]
MVWLQALQAVLSPSVLLYTVIGVVVGMFIGTLPGLTSTMAIAILTPLTFWLDKTQGFAMLIAVYNSALFSGGISAIVINTPGTPASIATTFDGYALTNQGRGGLALGLNTICSVFGGIFSTIILMVAAFPLASFALKFNSAAFFWLTIFGLTMMVSVSQGSIIKGMLLGFFGMMLSTVGLDKMLAFQRYTGGNIYLLDGITFIPVMIGLFGLGEMAYQIFDTPRAEDGLAERTDAKADGKVLPTASELARVTPSSVVAAIIGVVVGAVPGAGGDIASIITWDVAKKMSKHKEEFGHGSIEGVASTCTANNASIGGALTTALCLGVPGDSNTAVLLGSLMMYGLVPGPTLFSSQPEFVRNIMMLMIVANVLILVVGLITAKLSIKILNVRKETIWLAVFLLCCIGSFSLNKNFFDVIIMFIAGICGFIFRKMDFPLGPFILGLLLGKICEENMRRALAISRGSLSIFFSSGVCIILIIFIVASLITPLLMSFKKGNKAAKA